MKAVGTGNESQRVAWIEQVLGELPSGLRILDAGAGERQFQRLCTHLKYVSQDFAQYDGGGDGRGLHPGKFDCRGLDIVSDIAEIPEPDRSFDAVMCTEVFEHLPEPLAALKEFARLVRPGGHLIITAPFCSLTHYSPYHFYTGFSRYFYEKHLPAYGFDIVELRANGNYFEYMGQELRRLPSIAWRYSQDAPSRAERWALRWVLKALERFSRADKGSSELLHFGCHVHAVRRQPAQSAAA